MPATLERSIACMNKLHQDFLKTGMFTVEDTYRRGGAREPFTWFQLRSMFRKVARETKRPMIYVRTCSYNPWARSPQGVYERDKEKVEWHKEIYIQRKRGTDELVGLLLLASETFPPDEITKHRLDACWKFVLSGSAIKLADEWTRYCKTNRKARRILRPTQH